MKKSNLFTLVLLLLLFTSQTGYAQDSTAFKPSGKIIAKGFIDYSHGMGEKNNESGLDITRALLGYNYKFTSNWQAQIVIDGASGNSNGKLEPYLRNAFVTWEDKSFSISAGLIGLQQFSNQEKYWAHRYVLKSFQDLNKMGSSVDAGITASYKISPIVSVDATIINGEGYKKIEKNNSTLYGLGLSVAPIKNVLLRVYTDIYTESESLRDALPSSTTEAQYKDQYALSLFAGYKNEQFSAGAEYNNQYNKGFVEDKNANGYSVYATQKVAPKWNVYGRYDLLQSSAPSSFTSSWNKLDGQLIIVGAEFSPTKQVKISPNFRNVNLNNNKSEQYLFVNVEINI